MIHSKKQIPMFDELPRYIMQYLVTAWDKNKLAHFLKGLRSWAIILVKRKKMSEDYIRFSSIFRTSVII